MSTKSRFAVNAIIDLGLREAAGPVPLAAISGRQHISLSYLEQLFSRLRRAGLVASTRGPGGGYTLGRAAEAISLADVIAAVEDEPAPPSDAGPVPALWASLDSVMLRHMATISLAALLQEQRAKGVTVEPRPPRRSSIAPKPVPPRTLAPNSVFAFGRSFAK